MPGLELLKEADRQLTICNACRYCEGYCAVFPALELRREFQKGDVLYLAHLCHDCRACFYACMYTPPHEFAINIPKVMAEVRMASYQKWTWPGWLSSAFTNRRVAVTLFAGAAALVAILAVLLAGPDKLLAVHRGPGAFYEIIPYLAMVVPAAVLFFYALAVWLWGTVRFWTEAGARLTRPGGVKAVAEALIDALNLTNLKGGGPGCFYLDENASPLRRVFHTMVSWGFGSAFVSTTVAALYQEFFHWLPPYSYLSAPVIFGSLGGISMTAGVAGLLWLKPKSDPVPAEPGAVTLDYMFLVALGLASLTGMLTLVLRDTQALGTVLALHLGTVAAIFVTAPYGKFVHFYYHGLALIRNRIEQKSGDQ
jgi:citrate/tricarballylate utilization protein